MKLINKKHLTPVLLLTLLGSLPVSAEVKLDIGSSEILYSGYYAENPKKNPEDPTAATIILAAPKGDGKFTAELNFNYFGCQKQNTGRVTGQKSGNNFKGQWNGKVDGTSQSGSFTGAQKGVGSDVTGNYTVNKGKQKINACLSYHISPNGTFRVKPITLNWKAGNPQEAKNSHVILTASKNNIKASGSARYKFLSVYWVNYAEDGSYTVRPVKEKVIFSKKSITFTLSNLMKKVQKWPNQSKVKSGFLATVVSKKNLAGKTKFNYLFIPASAVK